jgi:hypothetical protein
VIRPAPSGRDVKWGIGHRRGRHVSIRIIQVAFRRHLDTTPTAQLRQVRLHDVHHDLNDSNALSPRQEPRVIAFSGFRW